MDKNKHLLLASSIGVLLLLILAAFQENFRREWRQIQAQAHTDDGGINVQLRQVVNQGLGEADRCTSCHVAMAPGEQSVTGAKILTPHKPVVHDPAEFGCTVCHAGQGAATEKDAAHGRVEFWPQPMIPVKMSYAGCGTCHIATGVPEKQRLERASNVFERLDCRACHRVDSRGGTIRPGGGGMEGPDLSRTGIAGYDQGWYEKHLAKSAENSKGPWKDSFAPVNDEDRDLLRTYLATRVAAPSLIDAKATFFSSGCLGCHKISGVGGDEGPDLSRAGEKDPGQVDLEEATGEPTLANWMADHFRAPGSLVANSQMPALGLSEQDIERLTLFTFSLRRHEVSGSYVPRDRMRASRLGEREFASDGATIFGAFCAGCHGLQGQGRRAPGMTAFPSIGNSDFLSHAGDALIRETIRKGRPGRRMPAWEKDGGLRPAEIEAVVRHLRDLRGEPEPVDSKPAHWVNADRATGQRIFETACSGCHGQKGEGGEGPALSNPVLLTNAADTYLLETITKGRRGTLMQGFGEPSSVHRTLSAQEIQSVIAYLRTWEPAPVAPSQGAKNERSK